MENVVVLGASNKPERYSYMAVKLLMEHEHNVFPINPVLETILGLQVYKSVDLIKEKIDTVSLYLSPKHLQAEVEKIISLSPKRVIFNPGTESESIMAQFEESGITVIKGCTLIMLKTSQF